MSARRIGNRFEIGEVLGQGGMGTVYSGIDTQTGQIVAIKALKSDILASDPALVERFDREGQALRKLNHPNIVKVLGTVKEANEHFIVMEHVGGGSLRDLMDEQPRLPVQQVMDIALDLTDALIRAHRLNIIHRDIKPANVLLAEDGTPRLSDFGVAQMGDSTRMTATGSVVGTLAYLSPEACAGMDIDKRSDIWAFGVMLYEMLAGRRPFEESNTAALLTAILAKPAPDLSQLRPDTPPALIQLIERMLEKDRDQRIASVRQVGAALEAIMAGSTNISDIVSNVSTPVEGEGEPLTPTPVQTATRDLVEGIARQTTPRPSTKTPTSQPVTSPDDAATQVLGAPVPRRANPLLIGGVVVAVIVILAAAVALLSNRSIPATGEAPTAESAASPTPEAAIPLVEPVDAGQYMMLVAQFEHLGGTERDVQRFIVDNLAQNLTEDVPFSVIRIRAYPGIVKTKEEAQTAAEANNAAGIIWGNYDDKGVQAEIQLGSLKAYPSLQFKREDIERIVNIRVQMTDERRQSLARQVIALMNGIHSFTGDGYEMARNVAVMEAVDINSPEVTGNNVAARFHRFVVNYVQDTHASIAEIDAAINLDAANPILYAARGLARLRVGLFDEAIEDARTAQTLGPKGWITPLWLLANDAFYFRVNLDNAEKYFGEIAEAQPDEWFTIFVVGVIHYLKGDYALARVNLNRAIELGADTNFPYFFAIGLALREGRFVDAQNLFQTVAQKYPDPIYAQRLTNAMLGDSAINNPMALLSSTFGNLTLRQWRSVIQDASKVIEAGSKMAEAYFMQGFAYCNLRDYAQAETAYSAGIEIDPELWLLYLMRADVRQRQNNLVGALADIRVVLESDQGKVYEPFILASQQGEITCENFFDADVEAILGVTPEATP